MTLQSNGGPGLDGEVERLGPWFHNLHLPGDIQTAPDHPLGDFPSFKWKELSKALPDDLTGTRALDIGCNAGFYSFELARRGAVVLGIDHDEHYLTQARWARRRFGLERNVTFRRMTVYELAGLDDTFELVLFMGVLYHLRYPLLALDLVTERVAGTLVLQTLTMPGGEDGDRACFTVPDDLTLDERDRLRCDGWPTMAFIEHRMAGDPTNWWVPDAAAVEAMLRSTGMRITARPGHEIWICQRRHPSPHSAELGQATGRALEPQFHRSGETPN